MATTPIYQNGTWGRVIAVTHNGTRINRPADGQSPWTAPAFECGTVTKTHPDYPDVSITIGLGKRTVSVMLPNTDARISPQWAALVANGTITDEMLATVEQPAEEVLAAAKATAKTAAATWLSNRLASGVQVEFASGDRLISGKGSDLVQLKSLIDSYVAAGAPNATPVVVTDTSAAPIATTLGEMVSLQGTIITAVETLRGQWATAYAAIEAATTVEGVEAALSGLVGG